VHPASLCNSMACASSANAPGTLFLARVTEATLLPSE